MRSKSHQHTAAVVREDKKKKNDNVGKINAHPFNVFDTKSTQVSDTRAKTFVLLNKNTADFQTGDKAEHLHPTQVSGNTIREQDMQFLARFISIFQG